MAGLDLSALGGIDNLSDYLGAGTAGNLDFAAEVTVGAAVELSLLPLLSREAPSVRLLGYDGEAESGTRLELGAPDCL